MLLEEGEYASYEKKKKFFFFSDLCNPSKGFGPLSTHSKFEY